MPSLRIRNEPHKKHEALLIGCGASGRNIAASARWPKTITVDNGEDADLKIDKDLLTVSGMEPAVIRQTNTPFVRRIREASEEADVLCAVGCLGGFAGGAAMTAVTKAARAIMKPVLVSAALPFSAEGRMRRSLAMSTLNTVERTASITTHFENDIINREMPNVRMTKALEVMNRVILTPLEEVVYSTSSEFLTAVGPMRYTGTYDVHYSEGIEWEKKAARTIIRGLAGQGRGIREIHLFLGIGSGASDSAEILGGEINRALADCDTTVWVKNRIKDGQNRVGVLALG